MDERVIPILACRDLDDVVRFYEALGFEVTYRQARPNPYLCLVRGGIDLHFAAVPELDPEQSLGSVIIVVPDTGILFEEFADGLRGAYGKLLVTGIPRITRPRRKQGTAGGFTVVDPGGNWLRITGATAAASGDEPASRPAGQLDRVLVNAARQGDAHGDEARAIGVLETGLVRHPDATAVERVPVLVYLAELLIRRGDRDRATQTLVELEGLKLSEDERANVAAELGTADELRREID